MDAATPPPRFTLIELLVAVPIIATLARLLPPARTAPRPQARPTPCVGSILKQTALAMTMYTDDNYGFFPPASSVSTDNYVGLGPGVCPHIRWAVDIQPYLGGWQVLYCPEGRSFYPGPRPKEGYGVGRGDTRLEWNHCGLGFNIGYT